MWLKRLPVLESPGCIQKLDLTIKKKKDRFSPSQMNLRHTYKD